jgi:site-specific recombinase XerD
MLKHLFPRAHARYSTSTNGQLLGDFAAWLVSIGYARHAARGHVRRLKQTLEAMSASPIARDAGIAAASLSEAFCLPAVQSLFQGTRRAFERFLATRGQLLKESDDNRFALLLGSYRGHLSEERGLAVVTVEQHISTIKSFLAQVLPADAPIQSLSVLAVERFVAAEGQRLRRQTLQHVIAHLRAFLRFCFDRGEVRERLDSIDAPRVHRGELPPRAISWSLVQRLLRSVDRSTPLGRRDHAILHLMAHYGLRPSEITALTLGSIDWEAQTLRVKQCKTRSDLILPLTSQTMWLLTRYLRCRPPGGPYPELFRRARTPPGPLTHYAVGDLYQKRARESGLPLQGTSSYCLRHSFAMRLLGRGVGIKAIGDLLGHRTLESTCVYLRLQTTTLREVALPLPAPTSGIVGGPA